ncbi:MAG: hypothetical protein OXL98_05935, partial [Acidimicrobiaceae bacterium]|nr:hypothetical protein [Acidimicrobiaceae bacterium]
PGGLPAALRPAVTIALDPILQPNHPTDRPTDRPTEKGGFYRSWRFRPVQGDFNATTDRHRFFRDDGRGASEQSRNSTRRTTGASS